MLPSRFRSMESAAFWARPASRPRLWRKVATWAVSRRPAPVGFSSRKRRLMVGIWFAGQARAMDRAMLLYRTLRSGKRSKRCTISRGGRQAAAPTTALPPAAQPPWSSWLRIRFDCRHCAAVGRPTRSKSIMPWHSTIASSEACCSQPHSTWGGGAERQKAAPVTRSHGTCKGRRRLMSSKSTTPMLKTSAFGVISPFQTSGAIVAGVPIGWLNLKLPGRKSCATPRSMTMTCGWSKSWASVWSSGADTGIRVFLLGMRRMLADFMSKWTTPRACTCVMAMSTCRITSATKGWASMDPLLAALLMVCCNSPPEQKSITR
mmetsp:Transcript_42907/g.113600  ORF Transcript_42907/g.113600 Transcript_42907/m.113600 type:complete len:319 (+) Transcript_42907:799-1755(+)